MRSSRNAEVLGADCKALARVRVRFSIALLSGVLVAFVGHSGCRQGTQSPPEDSAPPENLAELIPWAYQKLLTPPDPTPLPERRAGSIQATAAASSTPLRIRTLLDEADVDSDWQAPAEGSNPILVIRNRSLDDPGTQAVARVHEMSVGRNYRCLTFNGLALAGRKVGRIELRADFAEARELVLMWSRAGKVSLPLTRPGDKITLSISTEQLSDWDQRIDFFMLGVPAHEGNDIAVELLHFLPRESAYPDAVGHSRIMFGRRLRAAIYGHSPCTILFRDVPLPAGGRFATGLGVTGASMNRLRVTLRRNSEEKVLLDERVSEPDQWVDMNVTLGDWAGRRADVILSTEGPTGSVGCWADPLFYVPRKNPPRVLVYLIDTLGAKHMSLYGYHRQTTPNLDALASGGAWFVNAFSNASRTVESIPNFMLSMPTISHGVQDDFAAVPDGLDLLAEDFQRAGFATACFSTNVNAGPRQKLDRGFDEFYDHFAYYWSEDSTRTVPIEEVTEWMVRYRDRPVFVYVHTAEPHSPYDAPAPFGSRYDPDYTGTITGSHSDPVHGFQQASAPRDIKHVIALYDGEVAFADHRFGLFMDRLAELGLTDGLITVVTSDHGEQFLEHGKWKHGGDVHGELIRVPLIVSGPQDLIPTGRIAEPVQLLDIRPTLLDLCGIKPGPKMFGDSLRPLLGGKNPQRFRERSIFTSTYQPFPPHHALIKWPWKLMFVPRQGRARASFLLYNIQDDPDEAHELLGQNPKIAAEMIRELVQMREGFPRHRDGSRVVEFDRDHMERLKALGYIQE